MPTPEQTAKRMTYDPVFTVGENVRDMMAAHIAQAIKAERERVIKIVDEMCCSHNLTRRLRERAGTV